MRNIAILGSTGSIGTQALQIAALHPDKLHVELLTAQHQWQTLVEQALRFGPNAVVIANADLLPNVRKALAHTDIKTYGGYEAIVQCATMSSIDMVLNALVGFAGLAPTVAALKHGKTIALANKETLVVAGELVVGLAQAHRAPIIPVDSEHSAIFQCLVGERSPVEKVLLTASGGPFRTLPAEQLALATPEQALAHPNWHMGPKVTIDSATLMNKGFETMEAKWLFGLADNQIEVLVHPQSVVHSMVQFADGAVKAQLGQPDMRLPIQYALGYPERLPAPELPRLDFGQMAALTFEQPDTVRFPCLALALEAMRQGGYAPCTLNAANEVAVEAFLQKRITFGQIPMVVERTLGHTPSTNGPIDLDTLLQSDGEARRMALQILQTA
ncbi:MAG: 1-deoxy-D-xylulose-5-phosphate reductoisomerase [Bacteroidales bacterium]|nr:1-deoxy-D-xylulose-5-phosphate reductoisomerase [Bacteroidales bacterium]